MAKRPDLTSTQRKIVDRYYQHQDTIYATKLAELVSEIALASDAKKAETLWKRARDYLEKSGATDATLAKVCDARDMKLLAQVVALIAAGKPIPKLS